MSAFKLSDFFIGDFPVILSFGEKPDVYSARYNYKGHPGINIGCPSMTPILAAADGYVLTETDVFEKAGRGKYIVIVHDGFLTEYCHLNDVQVQKNQKVIAGQLIGHSNQSGLADQPHLCFRVAPCDQSGNKTEPDNGYGGYIDPLSSQCDWTGVQGLTEPVNPNVQEIVDTVEKPSHEYAELSMKAANYDIVLSYLKQTNFAEFLQAAGKAPLDADPTHGGELVVFYLNALLDEVAKFYPDEEQPEEVKPSFLQKSLRGIHGFIFR